MDVKLQAASVGVSADETIKIVNEHGLEVLKLIVDGLTNGLSKAFLLEALQVGGPILVEILNDLQVIKIAQAKAALKGDTSGIIVGEQVDTLDPVAPVVPSNPVFGNLIAVLLQKLLPLIMQQFGPQLLQALINAILQAINNPPTPTPAPTLKA